MAPYVDNVPDVTLNSNQKDPGINKGIVATKTDTSEAQGVVIQIAEGSTGSTPSMLNGSTPKSPISLGTGDNLLGKF